LPLLILTLLTPLFLHKDSAIDYRHTPLIHIILILSPEPNVRHYADVPLLPGPLTPSHAIICLQRHARRPYRDSHAAAADVILPPDNAAPARSLIYY